jgi:hypothetical protein
MDLGGAELSDEMARQVLQFDLATLILPEPDQRRLVRAHDPRIRSADELPAVTAVLAAFSKLVKCSKREPMSFSKGRISVC